MNSKSNNRWINLSFFLFIKIVENLCWSYNMLDMTKRRRSRRGVMALAFAVKESAESESELNR